MKPESPREKSLRRHLSLFAAPSAQQIDASRARIHEHLRASYQSLEAGRSMEPGAPTTKHQAWLLPLAAAAVIVLVVAPWRTTDLLAAVGLSRHAEEILAIFTRGMARTAGPLAPVAQQGTPAAASEFEEASIRPCDPDNVQEPPAGARGGGPNSFQMTPGRTHALCMTLATLIRTAYGYQAANMEFSNPGGRQRGLNQFDAVYGLGVEDGGRVRGGPDWVRSERFTIDAAADGGASAETMRGPMLLSLLEKRFKLKAHIESEQIPVFALALGSGGSKMRPAASGACEPLPPRPGTPFENGQPLNVLTPPRNFALVRRGEKPSCGLWSQRNGPNMVFVAGEMPVDALVRQLGFWLGAVPVIDRTGLTGRFNFLLEFVLDANTPGPNVPGAVLRDAGAAADVPRAATIFDALADQLGLRLERARAPREFIVIDHIERPSPN
jgi:uncharacterized protein (TIGR03435 family)